MNLRDIPTDKLVAELSRRDGSEIIRKASLAVASAFGVPRGAILGRSRVRDHDIARHALVALLRSTGMPAATIARELGRSGPDMVSRSMGSHEADLKLLPGYAGKFRNAQHLINFKTP